MQWVPGQCSLTSNELANQWAKLAATFMHHTSHLAIDMSLAKLSECMTLAYRLDLTHQDVMSDVLTVMLRSLGLQAEILASAFLSTSWPRPWPGLSVINLASKNVVLSNSWQCSHLL